MKSINTTKKVITDTIVMMISKKTIIQTFIQNKMK